MFSCLSWRPLGSSSGDITFSFPLLSLCVKDAHNSLSSGCNIEKGWYKDKHYLGMLCIFPQWYICKYHSAPINLTESWDHSAGRFYKSQINAHVSQWRSEDWESWYHTGGWSTRVPWLFSWCSAHPGRLLEEQGKALWSQMYSRTFQTRMEGSQEVRSSRGSIRTWIWENQTQGFKSVSGSQVLQRNYLLAQPFCPDWQCPNL